MIGPSPPSAAEPCAPHARILVVDDVPSVREVTRLALEAAGHEVHEAEDGRTALEAMERLHDAIDLVLTDVAMPGMDGTALAARVHERLPHLPILFVSANRAFRPPPGPRGRSDGFLPKPYRPSEVVEAVEAALA